MKAEIGSLLFIQDKNDTSKKRPHICIHVFTNRAGVPYNWLLLPITSKTMVGTDNLIEVKHQKLHSISYAKLNNIESVSWSDDIEISKRKFAKKYVDQCRTRLQGCFDNANKN